MDGAKIKVSKTFFLNRGFIIFQGFVEMICMVLDDVVPRGMVKPNFEIHRLRVEIAERT